MKNIFKKWYFWAVIVVSVAVIGFFVYSTNDRADVVTPVVTTEEVVEVPVDTVNVETVISNVDVVK